MITFAKVQLAEVWDEVIQLGQAHWEENEGYRHSQGFRPDKERYLNYEAAGIYYHFAAFRDQKMVGTGGVYVMASMHTQKLIATEDTYYIDPRCRGTGAGPRFFKFMEQYLHTLGVVEICLTTPLTNRNAERIVEFMGYQQVTKGWSKHLCSNLEQQ